MSRYTVQTWKSRNTSGTLISFIPCCSRRAAVSSHSFLSWNPNGSWRSQQSNRTLWPWWSRVTPRPLFRKALADRAISPSTSNELLSAPIYKLHRKENKYK